MKKFFLAFVFLGLFTFLTPKVADAAESDCVAITLDCPCQGGSHIVVVCGTPEERQDDYLAWIDLLCDPCIY